MENIGLKDTDAKIENMVLFDKKGNFIAPASAPEVQEIGFFVTRNNPRQTQVHPEV